MNFNSESQAHLNKAQYIKNRIAVRNANQFNNIEQAEYDKHTNNINWRDEPTTVTLQLGQGGAQEQVQNSDNNEGEGGDNFISG